MLFKVDVSALVVHGHHDSSLFHILATSNECGNFRLTREFPNSAGFSTAKIYET